MRESATANEMEVRGPAGDWHALRTDSDYNAERRALGGALSVVEVAGLVLRVRSETDLEVARWGPLAAELMRFLRVLPLRQVQTVAGEGRDMAQSAVRHTAKAEIVVLVHQDIPDRTLLRRRQLDLNLGQSLQELPGKPGRLARILGTGMPGRSTPGAGTLAQDADPAGRVRACNATVPGFKMKQPESCVEWSSSSMAAFLTS